MIFNTLQLQHTPTHCNTIQHTPTHCNTLQHNPTHFSTLQHTAGCDWWCGQRGCDRPRSKSFSMHCNTLQNTATHCNTLFNPIGGFVVAMVRGHKICDGSCWVFFCRQDVHRYKCTSIYICVCIYILVRNYLNMSIDICHICVFIYVCVSIRVYVRCLDIFYRQFSGELTFEDFYIYWPSP